MTHLVVNESKSVFYTIDPGKPSRVESLVKGQPDTRSRVVQLGEKGPSWYYAAKMLREQYGPKSVGFSSERKIEVNCSALRKELSNHYLGIQMVESQLLELSTEQIKELAAKYSGLLKTPCLEPAELRAMTFLAAVMNDFLSQSEFTEFKVWFAQAKAVKSTNIFIRFLESMGKTPEQEPISNSKTLISRHYEELSIKVAMEAYDFKDAVIDVSMDELITTLKGHGPVIVSGHYDSCNNAVSFDLDAIAGFSVLGFEEEVGNQAAQGQCSIVVVGAKKISESEELVYFVKPKDHSRPGKNRQVYAFPYSKFLELRDKKAQVLYHPRSLNGYSLKSSPK